MESVPLFDMKLPLIHMAPAARNSFQWRHGIQLETCVLSFDLIRWPRNGPHSPLKTEDPPSTTLRVKMDFHRFSSSFQEALHHLFCCSKHLNKNITFESLSIFQNIQSLCCSPHHVQLFTCSIAPSNILEPCKGSCGMATRSILLKPEDSTSRGKLQ